MFATTLGAVLSLITYTSLFPIVTGSAIDTTSEWKFSIKESIHPPLGWVKYSLASPDYILHVQITLPQPQFHVLE